MELKEPSTPGACWLGTLECPDFTGKQFLDPLKNALVLWDKVVGEKAHGCGAIDGPLGFGQCRLEFTDKQPGCVGEETGITGIERFLPKGVSSSPNEIPSGVICDKSVHAFESVDSLRPPFRTGGSKHFGVGIELEAVPEPCEPGAKFPEVVDFSIETQPESRRVLHRLDGSIHVNNRQSAVPKADMVFFAIAIAVRSSMAQAAYGPLNHR